MRTPLTTQGGNYLRVIYPGRRAGSWGPDFRGALITLDGAVLRGDVEIHVRPSDWHGHGHGGDPAYDRTVLHVTFFDEAALPAVRRDGRPIPCVALQTFLPAPLDDLLAD